MNFIHHEDNNENTNYINESNVNKNKKRDNIFVINVDLQVGKR